eukprot:jgi/Ulvmu1/11946/UM082_0025.1
MCWPGGREQGGGRAYSNTCCEGEGEGVYLFLATGAPYGIMHCKPFHTDPELSHSSQCSLGGVMPNIIFSPITPFLVRSRQQNTVSAGLGWGQRHKWQGAYGGSDLQQHVPVDKGMAASAGGGEGVLA